MNCAATWSRSWKGATVANDWIKMRTDLATHPKVVRISSALKADRIRVIGGLHSVWSIFDTHSADGRLEGYTLETLDDLIGWQGFSSAMVAVSWLHSDEESLTTPEFSEHNGQSAKRRAMDCERKRALRIVPKMSASDADKNGTREEKRREEVKEPHTPQAGQPAKLRNAIALQTYLAECSAAGVKPIAETDSVFDYANSVGIGSDLLRLQWLEFKARYSQPGAKRYKAWATVFGKSVRGNWFKLWYIGSNGDYVLSTVGQQAKRANEVAA